jgi:serine/threonine protein kinase/formylglycine-generating enzyme required for sulfatase activity/dienelactone hydrolase
VIPPDCFSGDSCTLRFLHSQGIRKQSSEPGVLDSPCPTLSIDERIGGAEDLTLGIRSSILRTILPALVLEELPPLTETFMIGQTISHYRILEKLGEGGMGVVYKAEDVRLKRTVALKFLPPELTRDPEAKRRFLHEAQAASALQHNAICTVHDIDQTDEGQLFIVMDFYEGETLDRTISRGPLKVGDAVDIAVHIARGLIHTHAQGIVHRDLKPANVLITNARVVKILDFGLAKLAGHTMVTKAGSIAGTVAYMSPEQARGMDLDARTDVWSLGVVLYEMLGGKAPFRGEHDSAILYSIVNEEVQPLSTLRPDLNPELSRVVATMLQKDLDKRYASMSEVEKELSRLQAGEPPSKSALLTLRKLRRPVVAIPLVLLLLALLSLAYYAVDRSMKASWARNVALPELIRLADAGDWIPAFEIGTKAKETIPTDSVLSKYMDEVSWVISFTTEPPGAECRYKSYADSSSAWKSLGTTPIQGERVPRGAFRVQFVKDGLTTVDVLRSWANKASSQDTLRLRIRMDSTGAIPRGMVRVPGGTYQLYMPGMDNLRTVIPGDYFLDKAEVTNSQYKQFMESGGYRDRKYWTHDFMKGGKKLAWEEAMAQFVDATGRPGPATWEVGSYPQGKDDYPVGGLSWYEAAAYAEFAGKSLPSIFHWNKAAFPWYAADVISRSNFSGNGPVPVGSKQGLSFYGNVDMAGNVREWCWNLNDDKRFILGGGWNDLPYMFTDAYAQDPFDRSPTNGVRCVRYTEPIADTSLVLKPAQIAHRDYSKEKPVSDQIFRTYLRLYAYDRVPLRERIESTDSTGDWVRQCITFSAAYGNERMMAYVYLPRISSPPYQTIVLFPGSESIFERSSKVLRAGYFNFFVKSGLAFVFPIYKGTYERNDGFASDTPDETNRYKEHVIQWVKDFSRVMDYIETRKDLDTSKVAYYGVSWGGEMGGLIPAVERRIKVVILNVGGLDLHRSQPEVDPFNFVPRIKVPVLMINGEYDQFFPVDLSQKPMYELLGTPREDKKQYIFAASHMVPYFLVAKQSLAWLDRYFGPVNME